MATKQVKISSIFSLVASFAFVPFCSGITPTQDKQAESLTSSGIVAANLRSQLMVIVNEAKEALDKVGKTVQQSDIGQEIEIQLLKIIKRAEKNGKRLSESTMNAAKQVKKLRETETIKTVMTELENINDLVVAVKQLTDSELGAKISKNLDKIFNYSSSVVNSLSNSGESVAESFGQINGQVQGASNNISQNSSAQSIQRQFQSLTEQARAGAQGYLNGFANYAKGAVEQIGNLGPLKRVSSRLGLGSVAAATSSAAAAA